MNLAPFFARPFGVLRFAPKARVALAACVLLAVAVLLRWAVRAQDVLGAVQAFAALMRGGQFSSAARSLLDERMVQHRRALPSVAERRHGATEPRQRAISRQASKGFVLALQRFASSPRSGSRAYGVRGGGTRPVPCSRDDRWYYFCGQTLEEAQPWNASAERSGR